MDRSAIQTINELALAATVVENTDIPVKALPENFKLHSLEAFSENRFRFRGSMQTHSIPDFVYYSMEQSDNNTQCYIDGDSMAATCFFNLGTPEHPGHGDHTATLTLKNTAPYKAMCYIDDIAVNQERMVEWLEDWIANIQACDAELGALDNKKSITAIRKITIATQGEQTRETSDFRAHRSAMENIEAKSSEQLPAGFLFTCTPYEGLGERTFFLRLSVLPQKGDPVLKLRVVQFEKHQEEMAEEFKQLLVDNFQDSQVETFIGQFNLK